MNEINDIDDYLKEEFEKSDLVFLARFNISRKVNKERTIQPRLLKALQQSIMLIPLWNGGFNSNMEFDVLVCFKNNESLKIEWRNGWQRKIEVISLENDIERWLYQKKKYFGWRD